MGFDLTFPNLPAAGPDANARGWRLPAIFAGEIVVSAGLVPEGATIVARMGSYESAPGIVESGRPTNNSSLTPATLRSRDSR